METIQNKHTDQGITNYQLAALSRIPRQLNDPDIGPVFERTPGGFIGFQHKIVLPSPMPEQHPNEIPAVRIILTPYVYRHRDFRTGEIASSLVLPGDIYHALPDTDTVAMPVHNSRVITARVPAIETALPVPRYRKRTFRNAVRTVLNKAA
jgi:hypothetical protein